MKLAATADAMAFVKDGKVVALLSILGDQYALVQGPWTCGERSYACNYSLVPFAPATPPEAPCTK